MATSLNLVNIFLPFFVFDISPYPLQTTLLWVGIITGSASLIAAVMSPFWGSLSHRFNPKLLYLRAFLSNSIAIFLMGFATNLHTLLILRILQGVMAGTSTIGLIIVSSSSPRDRITSDIGFFQSSQTLGQLVGPPLGSFAVVLLGYKGAFIGASALMFASFIFCYLYVADVPPLPKKERTRGRISLNKRVMVGWALCFVAMIQLTFLPSVLPKVFEAFHVESKDALRLAGIVVMVYTVTALVGTYVWSRLAKTVGLYKMITFLLASGILFQSLLAFSGGVVSFTVIRMIQTGLVAAVFALSISIFAREPEGSVIGFLNSSRFAGNSLGPILATSVLAISNLTVLYFVIAAITLVIFLCFRFLFKSPVVSTRGVRI